VSLRAHSHACDCAAHKRVAKQGSARWASLLPLLACAVCPACLATYAKLLSIVGVGIGLSEAQHTLLLAAAVVVSLGVSIYRAAQTKRRWPLVLAMLGAGLILFGHSHGELENFEWLGALVLLAAGVAEQTLTRRALVPA
jgi:hypothetical protein